jgi:membrane-bound lytic murein transglycosylase D
MLALASLASLAGCQSLEHTSEPRSANGRVAVIPQPGWTDADNAEAVAPEDVWERVRLGFQLQDQIGTNPRIEHQRLWFSARPQFMEVIGERSTPYLHYVVERLEERNMPLELALLPAIESSYNPFAYSRSHAVGLWQFIPSTGRYFNLRQTNWYDGRRDILASTTAAMDYLQKLQQMFDGDWLLALAAYNAGEGTVGRAIERNRRLNLPTDYWNLQLPKETQDYVPKLLALSQIVLTPDAYGVSLSPIANQPYFRRVAIDRRLDLNRVAELAQLDADELYQLNPAFKRRITVDGPKHLLVPIDKAELLTSNLSQLEEEQVQDWHEYRVRPGDSLHAIANRHQVTVSSLMEINELKGQRLQIGQLLNIPGEAGDTQARLARLADEVSPANSARQYRVRGGDTLWTIARQNAVRVDDIKRWNRLGTGSLRIGQVLTLHGAPTGSAGKAAQPKQSVTYYKVREGDSLYRIARRFNVDLAHLQRWNPRSVTLKPGQTLTLHLPN